MSADQDLTSRAAFLAIGKVKLRVFGLLSAYQLRNGWVAERRQPESGWRDQARWQLFASDADWEARRSLGGGEGSLERALGNVLRENPEAAALDRHAVQAAVLK